MSDDAPSATVTIAIKAVNCWSAQISINRPKPGQVDSKTVTGCNSQTYTQRIGANESIAVAASATKAGSLNLSVDCGRGPDTEISNTPGEDAVAGCDPNSAPGIH